MTRVGKALVSSSGREAWKDMTADFKCLKGIRLGRETNLGLIQAELSYETVESENRPLWE